MGIATWLRQRTAPVLDPLREWWAARRRRRETGLRPQQRARDAVADEFLWVVALTDQWAQEVAIEGTPLHRYGHNTALECAEDLVVRCVYPDQDEPQAYPASRVRPLAFGPGDIVRDRFTGNTLKVQRIRGQLAREVDLDGTPLHRYGENATLDCSTDWVVDCTYRRSNRSYAFPLSRLVPRRYPTRPEYWKEQVTESEVCFSCADGQKDYPESAACPDCRHRIRARDGDTCQQQGCDATEDLQVHHLYYEPGPTGTIPDRYLITLCQECHERRHGIR